MTINNNVHDPPNNSHNSVSAKRSLSKLIPTIKYSELKASVLRREKVPKEPSEQKRVIEAVEDRQNHRSEMFSQKESVKEMESQEQRAEKKQEAVQQDDHEELLIQRVEGRVNTKENTVERIESRMNDQIRAKDAEIERL